MADDDLALDVQAYQSGGRENAPLRRKRKRNWNWIPAVLGWLTAPLLCVLPVAGCVLSGIISLPAPPLSAPTPTVAPQMLLVEAEQALQAEYFEKVKELLQPAIAAWTNPDDLILAYHYLGDAEVGLGNYQAAALYCEKRYALQPTVGNLFVLAQVYDMGGDRIKAFESYQKVWDLESGNQADSTIDLNFVGTRLRHLGELLGTRTPAATATPSR